jgi:hypothetical protein
VVILQKWRPSAFLLSISYRMNELFSRIACQKKEKKISWLTLTRSVIFNATLDQSQYTDEETKFCDFQLRNAFNGRKILLETVFWSICFVYLSFLLCYTFLLLISNYQVTFLQRPDFTQKFYVSLNLHQVTLPHSDTSTNCDRGQFISRFEWMFWL